MRDWLTKSVDPRVRCSTLSQRAKRREETGDQGVPAESPGFLLGPPGAAEDHANAGPGGSGGALLLDFPGLFQFRQIEASGEEISRRVCAEFGLRDPRQVFQPGFGEGQGRPPIRAFIKRHAGGRRQSPVEAGRAVGSGGAEGFRHGRTAT